MGLLTLPGGSVGYQVAGIPPQAGVLNTTGDPTVTWISTFPPSLCSGGNNTYHVSGRIHLTFWQAPVTKTLTQFLTFSGGTAAAATPTLCRIGLYSVPDTWTGSMTCVAACDNDTALWAAANTRYTRSFTTTTVGGQAMPTSYQVVAGKYYATGLVIVTAAAVPTFFGSTAGVIDGQGGFHTPAQVPRQAACINSQTDLAFSIPITSLATNGGFLLSWVG